MKYINIQRIIAVISAGFILISVSGCQKKVETKNNGSEANNYQHIETATSNPTNGAENSTINESLAENTIITTDSIIEEEIINYFEDLEEEVTYYINEDNFDKLKDKAKKIVITGIDFIFYGTEIKGVTFRELTIETKEKIMSIVASMDGKFESKLPGYKETIKDKFGQGYSYVTEKLQEGINYIDGKLDDKYGEDYQDAKDKASEITEEVRESASNIFGKVSEEISEGFTKIKEWYEDKTGK